MKKVSILLALILVVLGSLVTFPNAKQAKAQEKVYRIAYYARLWNSDKKSDGFSSKLVIIDPDGQDQVTVSLPFSLIGYTVSWSPDRTKLAVFDSYGENIYFYNEVGVLTKTVYLKGGFWDFSWFFDSQKFLFVDPESFSIFLYDLVNDSKYELVENKNTSKRIGKISAVDIATAIASDDDEGPINHVPVVSPLGKFLAFYHTEGRPSERKGWLVLLKLDKQKFPYSYLDFSKNHIPTEYTILYSFNNRSVILEWLSDSNTIYAYVYWAILSGNLWYDFHYNDLFFVLTNTMKVVDPPSNCNRLLFSHDSNRFACRSASAWYEDVKIIVSDIKQTQIREIPIAVSHFNSRGIPLRWSLDDSMILYYCEGDERSEEGLCLVSSDGSKSWLLAKAHKIYSVDW